VCALVDDVNRFSNISRILYNSHGAARLSSSSFPFSLFLSMEMKSLS